MSAEEDVLQLYKQINDLQKALIEIDYLISYGKILEARTLIENVLGDNQALHTQRGIRNER